MGFHEVRFPDVVSRRSTSGPSTLTSIIEVDSGGEERIARYNTARWRGDAQQGVKSLTHFQTVLVFYRARNGPANGFRYKDWLDYATTPTGSTWKPGDASVTSTDVQLGVGDDSETQFQLKKEYTSGPTTVVRNLTKIVSGTVKVSLDDVEKTEGVDYSVNYNTGVITFNTAPSAGEVVKAGCEFDVPVRFGEEIDFEGVQVTVEGFDSGDVPSIPLVEIFDGLEVEDVFPMRGARDVDTAVNVSVTMLDGAVIRVNPTAAGVKILLPGTKDNLSGGGPYWFFENRHGSNSFELRDGTAGGTLIATLAAGGAKIVVLGLDSAGVKTWYAL